MQSGGGLIDKELQAGLTLERKLKNICEHYYKMDELMGQRRNITPAGESGPMGFDSFSEQPAPEKQSTDFMSTPLQTVSQLDEVGYPSWLYEPTEQIADGPPSAGQEEMAEEQKLAGEPVPEQVTDGAAEIKQEHIDLPPIVRSTEPSQVVIQISCLNCAFQLAFCLAAHAWRKGEPIANLKSTHILLAVLLSSHFKLVVYVSSNAPKNGKENIGTESPAGESEMDDAETLAEGSKENIGDSPK